MCDDLKGKQQAMKEISSHYLGQTPISAHGLSSGIGSEAPSIMPSIHVYLKDRAEAYRAKAHHLETMARNLPSMSQEFAKSFWEFLIENSR